MGSGIDPWEVIELDRRRRAAASRRESEPLKARPVAAAQAVRPQAPAPFISAGEEIAGLRRENERLCAQLEGFTAAWTASFEPVAWQRMTGRLAVAEADVSRHRAAARVRELERTIRLHADGLVTDSDTLSSCADEPLDLDLGDAFAHAECLTTCEHCRPGQDPHTCPGLADAILVVLGARADLAEAYHALVVAREEAASLPDVATDL